MLPYSCGDFAVFMGPTIIKSTLDTMGHPNKFEFQVFDGGANLTLQAAAKIICGSLNQLADNGVPISQEPWSSNRPNGAYFPFLLWDVGSLKYIYIYINL